MRAADDHRSPPASVGLVDRLVDTLPTDTGGVEYQCPTCGTVLETAHNRCPDCGELEIRERGSFEFDPRRE